ncbi:MAG: carboxyl transferase domain-containing protein [Actinomycetota bacterium]
MRGGPDDNGALLVKPQAIATVWPGRRVAGGLRHPLRQGATTTPERLVDEGSFRPAEDDLRTGDPLGYPGYPDVVAGIRAATGTDESVVVGSASIGGHDVELAAFRFGFIGATMGEVAGERLARGLERASRSKVPFVLATATGGARMQEGMRALVQMPKVVCARLELAEAHQPLVAALGDPTMGGVLASIAALADVTFAQTGAMVGFAGPRLVQRFTHRPLAAGSHTAESALEHGLVDAVVPSVGMGSSLAHVLAILRRDEPRAAHDPGPPALPGAPGAPGAPRADAWDVVRAARAGDRPTGRELIDSLADGAVILRGDRAGSDDPGLHAALARIGGRRAVVLALDRRSAPGPAACRKALRCLRIAERLHIPVVTLIDTPGFDPSESSEAGGIAWSIAGLLEAMLTLSVPSLAVVTGEGGSGGALALATADRLIAFSDSTFSVIGPESAAEILWRDPGRAPEAARLLKLTAHDLVRLGIADAVVEGPPGPQRLRAAVLHHLERVSATSGAPSEVRARRRRRWRRRG